MKKEMMKAIKEANYIYVYATFSRDSFGYIEAKKIDIIETFKNFDEDAFEDITYRIEKMNNNKTCLFIN